MKLLWEEQEEAVVPVVVDGRHKIEAAWAPQPGSQVAFLSCPVFEVLYEGTRGPGKTDALEMDFLQHVGKGYGREWHGILFRRTYPELADVISKSLKWFPRIFPDAQYNRGNHVWTFADGEELAFRYMRTEDDYPAYHGHSYPWIGWDELTTWPDDAAYRKMFSCSRSTVPGMPRKVRATTNPSGVGHNWVKARWRLPLAGNRISGPVIRDALDRDGKPEPERVAIRGMLDENIILMKADPTYRQRISASAKSEAERAAWLEDDWDIVAGGMFDDVWDPHVHVVPNLPLDMIPAGWYVDRSYDHGQSRPFSVGWWAQSNGEPITYNGFTYGTVRGDLYRIAEWYGWNGQPNEGVNMFGTDIGRGIRDRQQNWGMRRVNEGPADNQIFSPYDGDKSVAGDMKAFGISWTDCDKTAGSRVRGWQILRKMLGKAKEQPREEPGLFIMERCEQFRRTIPTLPRDKRDPDDVDTEAEDHVADEVRYRLLRKIRRQVTVAPTEVHASGNGRH